MMFFIFFLICSAQAFHCDFESDCSDFILDSNWGLTDGLHPVPIGHDHTLNTSAGHYIYYRPTTGPQFEYSQIQFKDWFEPTTDRATCFTMWFYTNNVSLTFSILFVQGDDEKLWRIAAEVTGQNITNNDWSQISVDLPAERVKIFIRMYGSSGPLAFDDLSIDYCASPLPPMPKVLYACDFEWSCSDNFISLPDYPYQWAVIQAGKPPEQGGNPPSTDFTYGNASGHYAWLNAWNHFGSGRVGYFGTRQSFNIQPDQSYCLNFEYYKYGGENVVNLKVYTRMRSSPNVVQAIWPLGNPDQYMYTNDRWTWSIINLPVGFYSLVFRVDTSNGPFPSSFVLDNIEIKLCDYPSTQPTVDGDSLLSLSCNFDDMSFCGMENGDESFPLPSYNFLVFSGDTVPKPNLGPTRDHTNNLTTGGFLYWNQALPFVPVATGIIRPNKTIEHNSGMCFQFAYYVNSLAINKNGTTVILSTNGCADGQLWNQSLDNSQGWQVVSVPVSNYACREKLYFMVYQQVPIDVSVAFDDIIVQQCGAPPPTSSMTTDSTPSSTATDTTTTNTFSTFSSTITSSTSTISASNTSTITVTVTSSTTYSSSMSTITATVTSSTTDSSSMPTITSSPTDSSSMPTVTSPTTASTTTTTKETPTTKRNLGSSQRANAWFCLIVVLYLYFFY
jgi:hypothetical protein